MENGWYGETRICFTTFTLKNSANSDKTNCGSLSLMICAQLLYAGMNSLCSSHSLHFHYLCPFRMCVDHSQKHGWFTKYRIKRHTCAYTDMKTSATLNTDLLCGPQCCSCFHVVSTHLVSLLCLPVISNHTLLIFKEVLLLKYQRSKKCFVNTQSVRILITVHIHS